jgi:predicted site-specific integrase-resolvase
MKKLSLPKEICELLRISPAQLCRLTKAGKIPAKDLGTGKNHCWRYDEEQLEKWIAQGPAVPDTTVKTRRRKQRVYSDLNANNNPKQGNELTNELNGNSFQSTRQG